MTQAGISPNTSKGQRRRQQIIEAAASILRENGPGSVTHRAVALRAGCSLSAMTYYFSGLDVVLAEAGRVNIARWATRAERAADSAERNSVPDTCAGAVDLVLAATLPADEDLLGHYQQLVAAGESPPVRRAYRAGRGRLNDAVTRVLRRVGWPWPTQLVMAVVDGACVSALSEGRDVREVAASALFQLTEAGTVPPPGPSLTRP